MLLDANFLLPPSLLLIVPFSPGQGIFSPLLSQCDDAKGQFYGISLHSNHPSTFCFIGLLATHGVLVLGASSPFASQATPCRVAQHKPSNFDKCMEGME